jgi:hypothetical protein
MNYLHKCIKKTNKIPERIEVARLNSAKKSRRHQAPEIFGDC